jgi:hypothetical protein
MPYTEQDLDEIPRSRDRLKAYYWRVAMNARRLAAEHRRAIRANKASFDEGQDLLRWAGSLERVAAVILANIDELVETTFEGES